MNFYIATRLENHAQHNDVRDRLIAMGHELTYDWTKHGPVWRSGCEVIRETAIAERQGVQDADFVVVLLPGGRGTHVELGMALALRTPVIIWAADDSQFGACPETCAFYHDPIVRTISGPLPIVVVPVLELERNGLRWSSRLAELA
jgi:hypothetical protein